MHDYATKCLVMFYSKILFSEYQLKLNAHICYFVLMLGQRRRPWPNSTGFSRAFCLSLIGNISLCMRHCKDVHDFLLFFRYVPGASGDGHAYRKFQKCCCTDLCTSGDSSGKGDYTKSTNVGGASSVVTASIVVVILSTILSTTVEM